MIYGQEPYVPHYEVSFQKEKIYFNMYSASIEANQYMQELARNIWSVFGPDRHKFSIALKTSLLHLVSSGILEGSSPMFLNLKRLKELNLFEYKFPERI